jgi:Holliday junction resolvase RusA-like endonuclease
MSPETIALHIPGEPVPFARAGANGKRRFTLGKQRGFMSIIKDEAEKRMEGRAPFDGPVSMTIRATYLVPQSWSQKRKSAALWKASKPDADNLSKLVKDALNTIVYRDDAQVACLLVQKVYGPLAGLVVTISELEVGK